MLDDRGIHRFGYRLPHRFPKAGRAAPFVAGEPCSRIYQSIVRSDRDPLIDPTPTKPWGGEFPAAAPEISRYAKAISQHIGTRQSPYS